MKKSYDVINRNKCFDFLLEQCDTGKEVICAITKQFLIFPATLSISLVCQESLA